MRRERKSGDRRTKEGSQRLPVHHPSTPRLRGLHSIRPGLDDTNTSNVAAPWPPPQDLPCGRVEPWVCVSEGSWRGFYGLCQRMSEGGCGADAGERGLSGWELMVCECSVDV